MRGSTVGLLSAASVSLIFASSVEVMKLSLLSTTRRDARLIFLVHATRILRRNNDRPLDFAVADIFHRLLFVGVIDGLESADIGCAPNRMLRGSSAPGYRRLHRPGPTWRHEFFRRRRYPAQSAAPEEKSSTPASAPESGKTCATRARQWPTFDSWLYPRSGRHENACALTSSSRSCRPV